MILTAIDADKSFRFSFTHCISMISRGALGANFKVGVFKFPRTVFTHMVLNFEARVAVFDFYKVFSRYIVARNVDAEGI